MNILYHHRTQSKGVEGVHIREIVKAFVALGHRVDILSPSGMNKEGRGMRDERRLMKDRGFSTISRFLPEIFFEALEVLYNIIASGKMEAVLKQKQYDLIYERYAIFNWAGVKTAKKNNIPIILEINYTSFMPIYRKRSFLLKPLAHWVDRQIFNMADSFVVVSTYLKDHLVNLGVDIRKIIVTTNAADPDRFNPSIGGSAIRNKYALGGRKVIGFAGGFYPWHGLDILLDSFLSVKKDIKDAVLLLIGDGPIKDRLQTRVKELSLEKDVIFPGRVNNDDLPSYIAAFDIAVMPDSNNYGSPMKVYEYMSTGKPVVAPRLGPLEDGITDGKEGLLFTPRNKNELSIALKKLLLDESMRNRMKNCARENIISKHTWRKNGEAVLNLYKTISDGRRRGAE